MADLALGALPRIFKACVAIKKAVATVKQNKEECRDIQRCVDRVTALLSWLQELTMGLVINQAFSGPLDDLADSMEEALELITDCQQKSTVRHLLRAGDMARKLRRVHDDILRKLAVANFSSNILLISVSVTQTLHYVGAHPPVLLPQQKMKIVIELAILPPYKWRSKALVLAAAADGITSMGFITGDGRDKLMVVGKGVDVIKLLRTLPKNLGIAQLLKELPLPLLAGQRRRFSDSSSSSGSSSTSNSDEESPLSSPPAPRPAAFEGNRQWKKQTLPLLAAQSHQQDVVAGPGPTWPDDGGAPPKGIMAFLRAAAAGLKASGPAYGIIFVFAFLLYLKIVTSSSV